jgi:hypothetical protein
MMIRYIVGYIEVEELTAIKENNNNPQSTTQKTKD